MRQAMTPYGLGSLALIAALSLAACSGSPSSSLGPNGPTGVTAASASFGPNGDPPVCEPPNELNDKGECVPPPPPPPGDQGCTPGYWKANVKKGASEWTLSPAQSVTSVFAAGAAYDGTSLLEALEFGGGAGVSGATQNLLRAAVAAVLNAGSPGVAYPQSAASIIAAVNAAILSGDRSTILALASSLDADNNLGCSLDNSSN